MIGRRRARPPASPAHAERLERDADRAAVSMLARPWPARVAQAGDGAPLAPALRAAAGGDHRFDGVRIFADARSADDARALAARAFTIGDEIHFGAGELDLTSTPGRALLAHELAHVQQQATIGAPFVQRMPIKSSLPTAKLRPPTRARGPNPATCMVPLYGGLAKNSAALASPSTFGHALARKVIACVRAAAPKSNARFAAEIVDRAEAKLDHDLADIDDFLKHNPKAKQDAVQMLAATFDSLHGRLDVSFRYDVVFVDESASWDSSATPWPEVDAALAAVPDEFLWNRSTGILRLHREAVSPQSTPTSQVGGLTESSERIDVYDAGVGATTMARSAGIKNMSTTAQTLRHEIGHLVQGWLRPGVTQSLARLMGWEDFPWFWAFDQWQVPKVPNPTCPDSAPLRNVRCQICDRAGFTTSTGRDWKGLDQFLAKLSDKPTVHNGAEWTHVPKGNFASRVRIGAVPSGQAFSYARESIDEYLSEIFAFALSDPEWVHANLPAVQVAFLKAEVFDTQREIDAALTELAINSPVADQFAAQAPALVAHLFTRQQIRAALAPLLSRLMQSVSSTRGQVA